jgi:hypothetical protein
MNIGTIFASSAASTSVTRFATALLLSVGVTASVTAPLTVQAYDAREVTRAVAPEPIPDASGVDGGPDQQAPAGSIDTTSTSPSTTTPPGAIASDPAPAGTTPGAPGAVTTPGAPAAALLSPSVPAAPPADAPPSAQGTILVSVSPDHSGAVELAGKAVSGMVHVLYDTTAEPDATTTFTLDGDTVEPDPLDAAELSVGAHSMTASVTQGGLDLGTVVADFSVER